MCSSVGSGCHLPPPAMQLGQAPTRLQLMAPGPPHFTFHVYYRPNGTKKGASKRIGTHMDTLACMWDAQRRAQGIRSTMFVALTELPPASILKHTSITTHRAETSRGH